MEKEIEDKKEDQVIINVQENFDSSKEEICLSEDDPT